MFSRLRNVIIHGPTDGGPFVMSLTNPQKSHQILLLLSGEIELQHKIEQFHRVFKRQQPAIAKLKPKQLPKLFRTLD